MAKVEIASGGPGRTTKIQIDGREVHGVRAYAVRQDVHTLPTLHLEIVVTELVFDADHVIVEAGGTGPVPTVKEIEDGGP